MKELRINPYFFDLNINSGRLRRVRSIICCVLKWGFPTAFHKPFGYENDLYPEDS